MDIDILDGSHQALSHIHGKIAEARENGDEVGLECWLRIEAIAAPRDATDDEIRQALIDNGFNPRTITWRGFCQKIVEQFYRNNRDIPRSKRNPDKDCLRDSTFGRAALELGMIRDEDIVEYLYTRSGNWAGVVTPTRIQTVRVSDVVRYLKARDERRASMKPPTFPSNGNLNDFLEFFLRI